MRHQLEIRTLVLVMMLTVYAAPASAQLFVGTSLNATGTNHDAFRIDVAKDVTTPLFNIPVWGATYDVANGRVLFTTSQGSTNGDVLMQWIPGEPAPTSLGTITAGGIPQRIDGLAMSAGILYGSVAGGTVVDGIFTIDMNTLVATSILATSNSISGIDADPATGILYGVDDTQVALIEIDVNAGTLTPVAAYPVGAVADVDGLAIGIDGRAYLIGDEPGEIYVFNLHTESYETPLAAPWTESDTFSGGAFIVGGWVLDGFGGVYAGGGASVPSPSTPYFGFDAARDLEPAPGGGIWVLDGFGGVHAGGGASVPSPSTPYFGFDVAVDLEVATAGLYVLDAFGGLHAGGGAPAISPPAPYFGFDVARDLELASIGAYVLDGFGGVHASGGAPAPSLPTPYFGFDVARDLELVGAGFYVLDGFGGVHAGGGASSLSPFSPYFGFDIARDLEFW